jgi:hypothetical protein
VPDYVIPNPPDDSLAPVIPFDLFLDRVFDWRQNQHIGVVGPTEQGKTNLIYHLLPLRSYVGYLGIKSRDRTLDEFATQGGYQRFYDHPARRKRWPHREITWQEAPRRLIWPDARAFDSDAEQKRVFGAAVRDIWACGCVTIVWDDFWYLIHILGLEKDAKKMLLNARSNDSPQVIAAQRLGGNRMVELGDQPTHLFFAKETDPRNLDLLGPARSPRRGFVVNLDRFQFLYENTRTGVRYRITAPLLGKAA